jgi:hypothetical protein
LLLADDGKSGAKVLILDDRPLRDLTQPVKGGVGQVEPAVVLMSGDVAASMHRRQNYLRQIDPTFCVYGAVPVLV